MSKKIHLLIIAILLFSFQITNSQVSNRSETNAFNAQKTKKNIENLVLKNGTTTRVPIGSTVLNYVQNNFGPDLNSMLTNIGFTVTDEVGSSDLDTVLPSQTWDLVILQIHDVVLTPTEITAISDYIGNGGKLIISYWDLNNAPTLQALIGVSNATTFSTPIPISVWDSSHAIFNTPNTINNFTVIGDNGGADNGDRLEPTTGSTALAGFVLTATTNEAAIVIANTNNTIYHGFSGLDVDLASYLNLIENEAEFLLTPPVVAGSILNYTQNSFGVDLNPMLTGNGFTVVEELGASDLDTILPSQSWDLAILQLHDVVLTAPEITAISNYISGGGKLIISYWDLSNVPALQTLIGVSNAISFNTPLPVSVWNASHSIFNSPNTISNLTVIGDNGGNDNGDQLEPDSGATALAGFVSVATVNEGAIILANNDRTIYHGFSGLDLDLTSFIDLVENEVEFLTGNPLNITTTDFGPSLNVYPNPTQGNITINLGTTYQNVKITTRNILGQIIDTKNYSSLNKINNFYVKGTTGTYFINIQAQDGKRAAIKILKK